MITKFSLCLSTLLLIGGGMSLLPSSAAAMPLVKNGSSTVTIRLTPDASEAVHEAAKILQEYVKKSTGATIAINDETAENLLFIGKHPEVDVSKLDEEGFVLRSLNSHNFVISGGSDYGIEYGVYEFLERFLGVRWLMPTDLGIDIPVHTDIDLPEVDILQEPTFLFRTLSPRASLLEWGRFNKVQRDGPTRMAFHHNLLNLLPASEFGKTHPEFYPLLNGERLIPFEKSEIRWQPNLSAPGIVDASVKRIIEYFDENPDQQTYSLGMNDSNNWDQSPESLARRSGKENALGYQDVSDDYFQWANEVVEKVLKKYPDKWFGTLAYNGLFSPPTRVGVHPRIIPFMTYDRMRWTDPELRKLGEDLTEQWLKAAPTLGWYGYDYGGSYLLPRVYFHEMQRYLSWGAAHQVKYHYSELYPNWGEGPKPWIFTRLLWNPNQDVDALLTDWYTHCAGEKAAPELARFYSVWEKFWTEGLLKSEWNTKRGQYLPFNGTPTYLLDVTDEMLAESDRAMEAALKLTDTPQRKARVEMLQKMWSFYRTNVLSFRGTKPVRVAQSEKEALTMLDQAVETLEAGAKRQELLASLKNDPLHQVNYQWITRANPLSGENWATAPLWQLQPWIGKSTQVRERIQSLAAKAEGKLREQADQMLRAAGGKVELITENKSFEEGKNGWIYWDKAGESKEYARGTWKITDERAFSGMHSLSISGLGRGGVYQRIDYISGDYVVKVSCYLPEGMQAGQVGLRMTANKVDGKIVATWGLPQQFMSIQNGEWNSFAIPFHLPKADVPTETKIEMMVLLDGFPAGSTIYIDDFSVERIR